MKSKPAKEVFLKISADLELPLDAVTQKLACLGRTGSGKSYCATKIAEEMLGARAQIVVLDPVGVWWGLRTGGGFDIPVFGGLHGDLPLEPGSGALVADLVVEKGICAVIDVSQFLVSEQRRFATDFAMQLFQRKKAAPSPLHFFIEEAQEFIPQKVGGDVARMVGAFERLIKLGRNFGLGATLISQRPQAVNKDVLNQTEGLFAFQMTGPQERKAIESWVAEKGADDDIVAILPKLAVGECHIWSPQWLGVSKTIRIAKKKTADVSSTPAIGTRAAVHQLAAVDVAALRDLMAATIEKNKQEDPKELQRELRKRTEELKAAQIECAKLSQELAQRPKVSTLSARDSKSLEAAQQWLEKGFAARLENARVTLTKTIDAGVSIARELQGLVAQHGRGQANLLTPSTPPRVEPLPMKRPAPVITSHPPSTPTSGLRRMMIALAQRPGLNAKQLGTRAGMSSGSGTFSTYLGKLRSNGWAEGTRDRLALTEDGLAILGDYEPLPTGRQLLEFWLGELGSNSGAARMLAALSAAHPRSLTAVELGQAAEISPGSGTFSTYLGKLRTLELISGNREALQASDEFFS